MENAFKNFPHDNGLLPGAIEAIPPIEKDYVGELLESMRSFDETTFWHLLRVADLAVKISDKIGLTKEETALLVEAALVHDGGKLNVDPNVLNKKDNLTADDWEELKKHIGKDFFDFLKTKGGITVARIAIAHHNFNDSKSNTRNGDRRKNKSDILIEERRSGRDRRELNPHLMGLSEILAIVDAFEALYSNDRPYKKAFSISECERTLKKDFPGVEQSKVIRALIEVSESK